ncbi:ribokinase [Thalassobaculum fulvum]|uniref:Ribokinase n=1 Tax=Thalassobaculum fulvum TaxID=1633335 RepID=A0A918XTI6_9PROT|nr:PfkB family carbohydrate kinase [Thalassobaculum fulvum]GHD54763.1 ribokinase [Thalassobaculum fulvum]
MIVVLGSINADLFFAVDRLPGRGETVLTPTVTVRPGGKGANQAAAAARAGAVAAFFGCVGEDSSGSDMLTALADTGCDVSGVRRVPGATGTAAVMVEAGGENQIVVASGANGAVAADLLADAGLGPGTTLVCQMEIPVEQTAAALRRARAAGARTVLNLAPARPIPPSALADVDVLVVNEPEARTLEGEAGTPLGLARNLAARHRLTCIVTLGGDGAVAAEADGTAWSVGVLPVAAVDTVGAGDAFVGVLAATLDGGGALPEAMRRASVAAGLACTAEGAMSSLPDAAVIDARLADLAPAGRLD